LTAIPPRAAGQPTRRSEVLKQPKPLIGPLPLGDRYGLVHDV
jgi:hypothetical protein